MYLTMMEKEEEENQARVGVVVVSHGTVAQGMAEVANRLLGVTHCRSVCMSLDEKPEAALARTQEMVKHVDEGRGVLLLVRYGFSGYLWRDHHAGNGHSHPQLGACGYIAGY